jgi:hypothetical protein
LFFLSNPAICDQPGNVYFSATLQPPKAIGIFTDIRVSAEIPASRELLCGWIGA